MIMYLQSTFAHVGVRHSPLGSARRPLRAIWRGDRQGIQRYIKERKTLARITPR
jgi:hypothetical protein